MDTLTVCNAALARLSEARIADLGENNAAARACSLHFPIARDELLRAHAWNFAVQRATLTALADSPSFGFTHQYQLPVDCLRVISVNGVSGAGDPSSQWEIEGGKLLSDEETCKIRYIRRVTDLNLFDSLALEGLIVLLASHLAPTIQGGSTGKATELKEEFAKLIAPLARRVDANESRRAGENQMDAMLAGSHAIQARQVGV